MGSRYEVEITLTSAKDLKNINWKNGPVKSYAVLWIDPNSKSSSRVDDEGDVFPHWNQTLVISFDSPIEESVLYIDIVHAKKSSEDMKKPLIGSAKLPLQEIVDEVGLGREREKKLILKRSSGRPHGILEVKVTVRQPTYHAPDPYAVARESDYLAPTHGAPYGAPLRGSAYGAPPAASDYGAPYGAPPPPSGYPYGGQAPPSYGQPSVYGHGSYGRPPSNYGGQSGYGQSNQGYVEENQSQFGGMGTGLAVGAVVGVLGGLAIAEGVDYVEDQIADDVAEKVVEDIGYDESGDW